MPGSNITGKEDLQKVRNSVIKIKYKLNMKNIFFTLLIAMGCFCRSKAQTEIPDSLASYVNFIRKQKLSAKDYVINLFDRYDIVVFCERLHMEFTQYQLLTDIISDERFQAKVGNVFMEIGGSNFDTTINSYLSSKNLSKEESEQKALSIQQNMCWYPLWNRYNYHYLLTSLYEINKKLPKNKKIQLHPTDIAVNWATIVAPEDVKEKILKKEIQDERDSVMAANILSFIKRNDASAAVRKKYFIILNSAHATRGSYVIGNEKTKSAATWLFEKFPTRTTNVLVNFQNIINMYSTADLPEALPILNGKLDAAFELLGVEDEGFDIKGSPLENNRFENAPMEDSTLTNEQVFTGFVYYRSFPKQEYIEGVPGIINSNFKPEYIRRMKLWNSTMNITRSEHQLEAYVMTDNQKVKKNPDGLETYWQKVSYWIGGGKQITAFYLANQSINEVVSFIKHEKQKGSNSDYNVTENAINEFGYYLMRHKKDNDALEVFKLNIELYPKGWNTYDSYGECLLKLNRKDEAANAYKKSLELNPDNEGAKLALDKLK